MDALIVGANGGIGRAFVSYLLQHTPYQLHLTSHRQPVGITDERCQHYHLDLLQEADYQRLAETLPPLDLLINCSGFLHNEDYSPEKTCRQADRQHFLYSMQINALPTLLLSQALHRHFRHKRPAVFATLSARVGSIEENRLGGWYSYRASKAALNQILKTLSIEWQRSLPNVCVAALHPGTTDTALSKPFQRNLPAGQLKTAEQNVHDMMQVITQLTPEQTGRFWSFDGEQLPW